MGNRVMSQRRQLLIGAVVAAGAGVIVLPALFRAGSGLAGMGDQVVVVRIYIAENKGTTLVIAIGTDPGIHSLRYAGGCSLLMHFEGMGSYFPFFMAIDAIAPMLSIIARP